MSFLSLHGQVAYNFMAMDVAYCILDMVYKAAWEDVGYSGVRVYMKWTNRCRVRGDNGGDRPTVKNPPIGPESAPRRITGSIFLISMIARYSVC